MYDTLEGEHGSSNEFSVRYDSDDNIIIINGGNSYGELEKNILNYVSTKDERYFDKLPESSDPMAQAAVLAAINEAARLFGGGDSTHNTGNGITKSPDVIMLMAMGIAGSTGWGGPSKREVNAALRESLIKDSKPLSAFPSCFSGYQNIFFNTVFMQNVQYFT